MALGLRPVRPASSLRRCPRALLAVQHLDHALAGIVGQRPDGACVGDGDFVLQTEEALRRAPPSAGGPREPSRSWSVTGSA